MNPWGRCASLGAACLLCLNGLALGAQRTTNQNRVSASAREGVLEGDLYLLTKGGDVKRGAANAVALHQLPLDLGDKLHSVDCSVNGLARS